MNNPTRKDKVLSVSRKSIALGILLVCVIVAARDCRPSLRDGQKDRIVEYTRSASFQEANTLAKATSLKTLGDTRLQDEAIGEFMAARMALCLGPKMPKPVYGERFLRRAAYEKHIRSTRGVATAVSPDGYFLTAAHCLFNRDGTRKDPLWVVGLTTANRYLAQANVIWLSKDHDMALIQARIKQVKWFSVSDASPDIGSTVIAGGCVNGNGAGKLVSLTEESPETAARILLSHSVPLIGGDSGGPLVDMNGHLVGINFSIVTNRGIFENQRQKLAHAHVVRKVWLQKLIQDHRNQMNQ